MKGIIKLFPATTNYIVENCIVRYNGEYYKVIENLNENVKLDTGNIVSKKDCTLMKYYIISKNSIIGEVNFSQYSLINDGEEYEYTIKAIHTRMAIGDYVEIFKPLLHNLAKYKFHAIKGVIISISNRTATVKTLNGEFTDIKRHRLRLLDKPNKRLICTLKI